MDEEMFGWDDNATVEDSVSFEVLPEGEYDFVVRNFKREKFQKKEGSASKAPNGCNIAAMTLYCSRTEPNGDMTAGTVFDRMYLYRGGLGRISDFLKCIGMIPADTPAGTAFPAPPGQMIEQSVTYTGRVKITQYSYKGKDGQDHKGNNVRYLVPEANMQPQQPTQPPQPPQQQQWGAQQPQQQSWGGGSWGAR